MIILQETNEIQQISFIPRRMTAYSLNIRNETTEVVTTLTPTFYKNDYYYTCSAVFSLKENHFYNLEVKDIDGNVIYLDKIFCKSQNTTSYPTANPANTIIYEQ